MCIARSTLNGKLWCIIQTRMISHCFTFTKTTKICHASPYHQSSHDCRFPASGTEWWQSPCSLSPPRPSNRLGTSYYPLSTSQQLKAIVQQIQHGLHAQMDHFRCRIPPSKLVLWLFSEWQGYTDWRFATCFTIADTWWKECFTLYEVSDSLAVLFL